MRQSQARGRRRASLGARAAKRRLLQLSRQGLVVAAVVADAVVVLAKAINLSPHAALVAVQRAQRVVHGEGDALMHSIVIGSQCNLSTY